MKVRRTRLFVSALVAGAAALAAAPATMAATPAKVKLQHSSSPAAARTPSAGSVPGSTQMDFEIDLKLPDQSGAEALAQAVSTPGNASFGKYVTSAQWEARFSPTSADIDRVRTFLTQNGFTVDNVSSDRTAVEASGTAGQVEATFGTSLGYHRVDKQKLLLAQTDLSVPADIAGVVGGVTGVSDTPAKPSSVGGPSAAPSATSDAQPPAGFRNAQPCGTYLGQKLASDLPQVPGYPANPPYAPCGYTPPQIRSAYGLTDADNGAGRTVAIIDAYAAPTIFADAHQYAATQDPGNPLKASQFSQMTANTFNKGGQCGGQNGWWGEETLDVEAVHSTAPGANILYAGAKNCDTKPLNHMLRKIVDGHLADVITNSYDDPGGDVLDTPADRQSTDNILLMAAATGVSVLFSSGDDGDDYIDVGAPAAEYPASSPWATAAGGTSLAVGAAGQRTGEWGWSTASSQLCNAAAVTAKACTKKQLGTWGAFGYLYGSGGGTSVSYPQPFYQRGVVPRSLATAKSSIVGPQPMRVLPDVSMDADPSTGLLVGETQTFPDGVYYDTYRIGGTSLSSPLLAGVVARADQVNGGSVGFLNPRLYAMYGRAGDLSDILPTGSRDVIRSDFANSVDDSDGILFSARALDYEGSQEYCNADNVCSQANTTLHTAPGYDNMTGLGSPAGGFVAALAGGH